MNYLTNYYKNLSEQLQEKVNNLEVLLEYYKKDERFQQSVMDLGMPTKADRDRMEQETGVSLKYSKDGSPAVYSPYGDISDPNFGDRYNPSTIPDFYDDLKNRIDMETLAMDPDSQKTSLGELETLITTKGPERYNRRIAQHNRQEDSIASQIERERDARFPELAPEKREIVDREKSIKQHNDFIKKYYFDPITELQFKTNNKTLYKGLSTLEDIIHKLFWKQGISPADEAKLQSNPTKSYTYSDWRYDPEIMAKRDEEGSTDTSRISRQERLKARQIKNPELFRLPEPKQQEQKFRHWSQDYIP